MYDLVFKELLGINYAITQKASEPNLMINYSLNSLLPGICVKPNGLLNEDSIDAKWSTKITFETWNSLPIFFKNETSGIPFDIFSAIFYCVSRYEEYLDFEKDIHKRFTAENSFLLKYDVLHLPIVNQWVIALLKELQKHYKDLKFQPRKFQYVSTIDIDQAWKFKH